MIATTLAMLAALILGTIVGHHIGYRLGHRDAADTLGQVYDPRRRRAPR